MARTKAMALQTAGTNATVTRRDGPLRTTISKSRAPFLRIRRQTLQSVYTLGNKLGSGNFGVVYKCKHKVTGEKLACKSFDKHGMTPEDCYDVMKEVQIMQRLAAKENVIQLKAFYEDEDAVHLVMERCFGRELYDRVVEKTYCGEREAASICRKIVEGVRACHSAGVMHRDLKLKNILFLTKKENSAVKIIDFGLSLLFKHGDVFDEDAGTPQYMAPEMFTGNYGQEVDLWSAGVILYTLLCGSNPFQGDTTEDSIRVSVFADISFNFSPWEKISDGAKDLVKKLLERDRHKRYTADQVLSHPWILEGAELK